MTDGAKSAATTGNNMAAPMRKQSWNLGKTDCEE